MKQKPIIKFFPENDVDEWGLICAPYFTFYASPLPNIVSHKVMAPQNSVDELCLICAELCFTPLQDMESQNLHTSPRLNGAEELFLICAELHCHKVFGLHLPFQIFPQK